jgi:hypothetical protein
MMAVMVVIKARQHNAGQARAAAPREREREREREGEGGKPDKVSDAHVSHDRGDVHG